MCSIALWDRDDLCLYTKTGDSVLRVFMPVIDDPHRLQLHTSFDRYSFVHDYLDSDPEDSDILALSWLDREIMNSALIALDSKPMDPSTSDLEQGRRRRIRQVIEEGWDMFALLGTDGSLTVRALAVCALDLTPWGKDVLTNKLPWKS